MISIEFVVLLLALGAVVGVLSGLLGIGGGLIMVPALLYLLPLAGISPHVTMHFALGTSLATAILTTGSSAVNHIKLDNVVFYAVKYLLPGIILGGFLGSSITQWLPSQYLPKVFGVIVFFLSIQMFLSIHASVGNALPNRPVSMMCGVVIGTLATLAGISGGSLTVPFLNRYGLEMKQSVGTASVCGFVIAISGVIGFIWHGAHLSMRPAYSIGYIYLPALLCVACVSMFTARLGARLTAQLHTVMLKKIFAVFLIFVSINMLLH